MFGSTLSNDFTCLQNSPKFFSFSWLPAFLFSRLITLSPTGREKQPGEKMKISEHVKHEPHRSLFHKTPHLHIERQANIILKDEREKSKSNHCKYSNRGSGHRLRLKPKYQQAWPHKVIKIMMITPSFLIREITRKKEKFMNPS